jgi:hypothetical protein
VQGYEVRFRQGNAMSEADFLESTPIAQVRPGPPGTPATATIADLKQLTPYVVGVRALGKCGTRSSLVVASFETPQMKFTTLSGCFIATAAHGSPMAPELSSLRWLRDHVIQESAPGHAAVQVYYRASPPLADLAARDDTVRAVMRRALAPIVDLARSAQNLAGAISDANAVSR